MCLDQVVCSLIIFICVCASAHKIRGIGSLVRELQAVVSCPTGNLNWGLGEQEVLLNTDPSLQSFICILKPLE